MSDKVPTDADGWPNPTAAVAAAAIPSPNMGHEDTNAVSVDAAVAAGIHGTIHGSPLQKAFANLNLKTRIGLGDVEDDDDSLAAEASSSTSSVPIDPKILRSYNWSPPLPWSTFLRLRRSWGQIKLTQQQEENVFKALEKLPQGKIHDALPFVSAFIDKHCPELRHKNLAVPRPGATFLLLSVITGHVELCSKCLTLGANPNSCKFLTDTDAPDNQMKHGYSPMFLACICEQLEIMNLLRQHRGSIHIVDRWGRTPLHAAAAMGSTEVVRWLLKEGAPRKVVDVDLQMPGELCVGKVIPQLEHPSLLFTQRPPPVDGVAQPLLCTCCRGRSDVREMGRCGCVDDMFTRWYSDRLRTSWSTTFSAVRDVQSKLPIAPNSAPTSVGAADMPSFPATA